MKAGVSDPIVHILYSGLRAGKLLPMGQSWPFCFVNRVFVGTQSGSLIPVSLLDAITTELRKCHRDCSACSA